MGGKFFVQILLFPNPEHPYVFISRKAFIELLEAEGSTEKAIPLIPKVVPHLRMAMKSPNLDISNAGLQCLKALAASVGESLNPLLKDVLIIVGQKLTGKDQKQLAQEFLQIMCERGGEETVKIVKSKIPTFQY
jgi:hypothetical protein